MRSWPTITLLHVAAYASLFLTDQRPATLMWALLAMVFGLCLRQGSRAARVALIGLDMLWLSATAILWVVDIFVLTLEAPAGGLTVILISLALWDLWGAQVAPAVAASPGSTGHGEEVVSLQA